MEAMTSELVNKERNIYFIQYGINPNGLTPSAGNCSIDHSSIDWSSIDVTGGFGTHAEISYDKDSFHGVRFYKADNSTPFGLYNTCYAESSYTADGVYPAWLQTSPYLVPESNSYKTVFGGYWGTSPDWILSTNLESNTNACDYDINLVYPKSVIWLGSAVNELYRAGEANQYGFYYQILPTISFTDT